MGAGVEQGYRERMLLLREPVGHRADSGRKIARFADAESKARERELGDAAGKAVRHVADRPDGDRDRVAEPRTDNVDDKAKADIAEDRKRQRLNSSHSCAHSMPSSA